MALIIYPIDDWDSFISVTDADAMIGGFVESVGQTAYLALDEAGKEAILRQTALQISLCPGITLPDENSSSLEKAQCYLVTHALEVNMMSYDPSDDSVTSETVGEISVSYDTNRKDSNDSFPPIVTSLLSSYGCKSSSGGFSQAYVGRS